MRCEQCGSRVAISEKRGRQPRHCSNACRQKAYRARKSRSIPTELTEAPRWVRWEPRERNGKISKVPVTVHGHEASVTNPRTWTTFERARAGATDERVGIVLGGGLGAIDLDHCIDGGEVAPWAQGIIAQHREDAILIELSPSGTGVHIFLPMAEAPGRKIRDGDVQIEIYSRARYMTVTGKRI